MAATIQSLVAETKRNKLSLIGPLSEYDVLLVWERIAQFVETLMLQQKGVSITGLGTFTFSKRKIDVGNNKAILIRRPVFALSERFIQTHSLHCIKQRTSGQVPLHPLNYTLLSNETGLSRELVEGCVREVLQALSRSVAARKSIDFDIKDIGRLTIHDGKAKMTFFREFILRLDSSSETEGVFRLSTAGSGISSIMTNPQSPSRPSTTLSLPRIVTSDADDANLSLGCSGESSANNSFSPRPLTSASDDNSACSTRLSMQLEKDSPQMATISEEEEEEEENDEENVGASETGVRTIDRRGKIVSPFSAKVMPTASTSDQPKQPNTPQRLIPKPAVLLVGRGSSGNTPSSRASRSRTSSQKSGTRERAQSKMSAGKNTHTTSDSGSCSCALYSAASRPSTCSHESSAGQELCYLCHQRALKNVPVDMSKEREALEKWHSDALQEYQRRSELLAMARAQANKTKRRLINLDVATFNQSRADSVKMQKSVKSSEMEPSYVFCDRSPTPAPHLRQQRYCGELDSQVELKHSRTTREREEEEREGREEQARLAKELAAYEELYKRMKAQSVEDYKAALKEQVSLKTALCHDDCGRDKLCMLYASHSSLPPPSSSHSSRSLKVPTPNVLRLFTCTQKQNAHRDGCTRTTRLKPIEESTTDTTTKQNKQQKQQQQHPVFGVHNVSYETCEKERAKAFFLDQLSMVEERKRREKEKALQTLRHDADMLKKTKEDLKVDLRKDRSRRVLARQAIEQEWLDSMKNKQQRLLEDLQRAREQGIRLHQQCENYLRCRQCQRKRQNFGKSNILHETRYISGSRLMV